MAETKDKLHLYLSSERIQAAILDLATRISDDYRKKLGPGEDLLVVVTLKGAMFFAADLVRALTVPVKVDFVRLASYGAGTKSSGTVRILKDIEDSPQGNHVLVLDEIVDSGRTLNFLMERINSQAPKSLKICALLDKPSGREIKTQVDYVGLEVEDKFLVGYGLDFNERYRNLPEVYYVQQ